MLLGSLSGDQVDAIMRQGGWTAEQQALLAELYMSYVPREKRPLNGQDDPGARDAAAGAGGENPTNTKEDKPS